MGPCIYFDLSGKLLCLSDHVPHQTLEFGLVKGSAGSGIRLRNKSINHACNYYRFSTITQMYDEITPNTEKQFSPKRVIPRV